MRTKLLRLFASAGLSLLAGTGISAALRTVLSQSDQAPQTALETTLAERIAIDTIPGATLGAAFLIPAYFGLMLPLAERRKRKYSLCLVDSNGDLVSLNNLEEQMSRLNLSDAAREKARVIRSLAAAAINTFRPLEYKTFESACIALKWQRTEIAKLLDKEMKAREPGLDISPIRKWRDGIPFNLPQYL